MSRRGALLRAAALAVGLPVLFPGALPGPRVVSADDHLSVHPAFQEAPGGAVRHPHLSDPAVQLAALDRRVVEALRAGDAPLWNPDLYGGAPLLADAQSRPASPLTLLKALLPADLAQDLGVSLILLAAGTGAALLAARLFGPAAALAAGFAAMTGPFLHVWLLHPHASALAALPWLLLAIEARHSLGVALSVFFLISAGHPGSAAHGLLIALAWAGLRRGLPALAAGGLAGGLLAAPLWLPFAEVAAGSTTAAARVGGALDPRQLLDLLWPGWLGHPARGGWSGPGVWADGQLHPGLAALILALVGARGRPGAALLGGWALAIALSVTGLPGPVAHGRLGSFAALLPALAAGAGAARLCPRGAPTWRPVALGLLVLITGAWARRDDQGSLPAAQHAPAPAPWALALARELGCAPGAEAPDIGCGRVLGLGWAAQPNTGALAGLRDLRGYDLPVSADTHRLMAALASPPRAPWYPVDRLPPRPLLDFAAVRVVLSEAPIDGLPALDLGPSPLRAHALDLQAPRAFVATAWRAVPGPDAGLRQIAADPQARARPPVELPAGLAPPTPGPPGWSAVPLRERGASRIEVALPDGAPAGLLVIADAWAPGWTAEVDGRPSPVLRVGGAFRGVFLSEGSRYVQLRYRPPGWTWGLRLGGLGLLGIGLLAWPRRRRPG